MNFQVIRATVDHASDMGRVHAQSWQKAYKGIIPDDIIKDFTPEKRAAVFKQAIATRPEEYYFFKADNCPAGLALLHKSHEDHAADTDGEIYAIYFHPDFWGTTVTHKAFRFCMNRLQERGFSRIIIWTLEDNIRARKFYEKHGFAYDGAKQPIDIGKSLTEIRYVKTI